MKRSKPSTLAQGMNAAAGKTEPAPRKKEKPEGLTMIGAHFKPEVRKMLLMIRAHTGQNIKQVLGTAMNKVAGEFNIPQAYAGEE